MFCRRSLVLFFGAFAAFQVQLAHADPSPAEISSARHAFEAAVNLENGQHWAEAELRLREALVVKDTAGLRYHLAHCEAEQGHLLDAAREYERARELLRQGAKAPDVQKLLEPAIAALDRRIPRLTIELPSELISPAISLDGKAYAPSEAALGVALDPGPHQLHVSASGRRSLDRALALKEGEQIAIRADLAMAGAAPPTEPRPSAVPSLRPALPELSRSTQSSSRPSQTKLYLLIGESALTLAGVAVGIAYRAAESHASDRIERSQAQVDDRAPSTVSNACGSPASNELANACAELKSAIDAHDRDAVLSTIGFVTAGVGAAALVTTFFAYPSPKSTSSGLNLRLNASLGRVALSGRF